MLRAPELLLLLPVNACFGSWSLRVQRNNGGTVKPPRRELLTATAVTATNDLSFFTLDAYVITIQTGRGLGLSVWEQNESRIMLSGPRVAPGSQGLPTFRVAIA